MGYHFLDFIFSTLNMQLKHTKKLDSLPDANKELALALYAAYAASVKVNHRHKTQQNIQHCLGMVVTDATEVRLNLDYLREIGRGETNPKPKVALLQPHPVAAQEPQEGLNSSEIANSSTQDQIEPQNEQPKGKRGRKPAAVVEKEAGDE